MADKIGGSGFPKEDTMRKTDREIISWFMILMVKMVFFTFSRIPGVYYQQVKEYEDQKDIFIDKVKVWREEE